MSVRKRSGWSSFSSEKRCELLEKLNRCRQFRLPFDDRAVEWNRDIAARPAGMIAAGEFYAMMAVAPPARTPPSIKYHP